MFPSRNSEGLHKRSDLGGFNYIHYGHQTYQMQFFFNSVLCPKMWYLHLLCSLQIKERTLWPAYLVLSQGTVCHLIHRSRKEDGREKKELSHPGPPGEKQFTQGGQCMPGFSQRTLNFWWVKDKRITEAAAWDLRADRPGFKSCLCFWVHILHNSFLGICPRLIANIMWLAIARGGKKKKEEKNRPKHPKMVKWTFRYDMIRRYEKP